MTQSTSQRPNIVLIITDQQRYDTIAALGFPYMDTPNLDRLVHEGITFTNSFVSSASCAPARASLFKGYYPHTTGIYKNADTWRHSWVEDLAAAGYYCVNIGKMHTYPYETPLGFHERFVVENKDRYLEGRWFFDRWDMALQAQGLTKPQRELYRLRADYKERLGAFEWELPEKAHSDFFVGNLATWWIEHKPKVEPLFLQIGFPGPHPPYDPIPRYAEPYLKKDLPLPQVTEEELAKLPRVQQIHRDHDAEVDHDSIAYTKTPTREQLHRQRAYYLANVTMIDEKIGEILQALEAKGYLENAVVIFTTDHGDDLSDHGLSQKWSMYDIITRTPLIVWAPGRFQGGRQIDALVQQFDIAPVIMELAGLPVPAHWETESLMPFLKGEGGEGREYVFAEQAGADALTGILFGTGMMTMVRNKEWKLVHYLDNDDGELYDLRNDPGEHNNLWWEAACREKREELLGVLRDWLIRSNLRAGKWCEPWR
ncbi:MAG: sulfatase-like hydrolase/transferase [Chloroflexi bacterium]|nr:sulfatase-like hydrolase/transferase [Chloroflexota bacterium]